MRVYLLVLIFFIATQAQANPCLKRDDLQQLDRGYEEALRIGNIKFLNQLLAEEFVWVHNLAVEIENKNELMARLQQRHEVVQARVTRELGFHRLDNTVVISGLSSVKKTNPDGKTARTSHYRFLRTYVMRGERCYLLAVQTMKTSTDDESPEQQN